MIRLLAATCISIVLSGAVAAEKTAPPSADEQFEALLERHWQWKMSAYPEEATYIGDRRFDTQWTDWSLEGIDARHQALQRFANTLDNLPVAALSEDNQLTARLLSRDFEDTLSAYRFRQWLIPLTQRGGIQSIDQMADQITFRDATDYRQWLTRLERFDRLMQQTLTLMRTGIKEGRVPPAILMERIPDQIKAQIVESPTDSPFYAAFADFPDTIDAREAESLRAAAKQVISNTIVPSYERMLQFMTDEYLPACRSSVGIADQPDGRAYYQNRVRHFTTTDLSADEIHTLGLQEVARIRAEMEAIIAELEFDGDFAAFLQFLRTDPQFYFDNGEDLRIAYESTAKRIDPELVKLFGKLPRTPYGIRPIPDAIAPDTYTAYYSEPAADGSRAGYYYVNLYRPDVRPKYEIEVLTVHEAMPGHHLQIALAQELGELPMFRRFIGFTAFVEGWALYSESLGEDLGLYEDPYSKFGQLTYEMWRAVRLVVDTGIHHKGWSRQQAIDFFAGNAAKAKYDIVNEVDRYISWPGQALAYKIGQLRILSMRRRAEQALGEHFDIKAFHDEILSRGALPLDVLEAFFDAWLARQLTN